MISIKQKKYEIHVHGKKYKKETLQDVISGYLWMITGDF